MKDKIMRCDIDLDWVTFTCACGRSLCTRQLSQSEIDEWMAKHKPHTDKLLSHTTDAGNTVWAERQSDTLTDWKELRVAQASGGATET